MDLELLFLKKSFLTTKLGDWFKLGQMSLKNG
jgi:hypothetical protein